MSAALRPLVPAALACLVACTPPWPALEGCPDTAGCSTGDATTGGETPPTTAPDSGIQTVTGATDDTGSTSSGAPTDTTGAPDDAPPVILDVELTPDPIQFNGPIAVSVNAQHADGVRMKLDTGAEVELEPVAPGVFGGEIAVYTGLDNGPHVATLTPTRELVDGEPVDAPYTIALPKPGSQGFWETGDLIGQGQVAAMGVLPDGDVVELGSHSPNGATRCYLRRRDKGGAWAPSDVVDLLPDIACAAIDLKIDAQGTMFVLVHRQGGDGTRWWLARLAAWGAEPESIGLGTKGETAVALAAHPSGMVAACGYAPSPALDDDAMTWIFRPGLPGETRVFDYRPPDKGAHTFLDHPRDCVFAGDILALVGETFGKHGQEKTPRDRLFILRTDKDAPTAEWEVAPPGIKMQSGAQAVDVDALGRLVVGGYMCDDDCEPEGLLRIYDGQGNPTWSLGMFPTKQWAVHDLAWSPAGYAVVATGGTQGSEAAFTVRAFKQWTLEPVWTFARQDNGVLHSALALAIGAYGEIYAGGFGANGYPAVAYIGG